MKIGDKVLVPRTSGEKTVGTIIGFIAQDAVVEFPIGNTYRGRKHDFSKNKIATKTVAAEELTSI